MNRRDSLEIPLWRGSAFPATPIAGRMFYRTDLDLPFWYDATRAKWLGELESDGAGVVTQAGAGYLRRFAGAPMAATVGIYIPYAVTIVGISYSMAAAVAGNFEIRRAGTAVATISHAASANNADMTLDANFAAGGVLSIYNSAGTVNNVQIRLWWRRHES